MKKQSFLLVAGSLLTLAACQNNANEGGNQAQIDSMVNMRVEELRVQMMAQNDSIINAESQRRADSIIAAMKGGNTVTTTTHRTTTVKNTPGGTKTSTQTTIGNGKPAMGNGDNNSNTVGNGKPKMGEGNNKSNNVGSGKPKMGDK
jgi:hypothetical protein